MNGNSDALASEEHERAGESPLFQDTAERKQAEEPLERRVRDRTAELARANADLQLEIHERKRAEEAVKAERQRLHDVLEMLPAYVVLLSPDHHVPFENRFFRERFGESHGRRCFEYLFGRSEPCETCESYKPLETGASHHWEWTGPDGRNYDIFDFPFTDSDGSPLVMEMGIDITERKWAEEALQKAHDDLEVRVAERTAELAQSNARLRAEIEERRKVEEALKQRNEELEAARAEAENERRRLEAVMEALPVGVAITDVQGGAVQSNSAFERVWGSPRPAAPSVSDYDAYRAWWVDTGKAVAPQEWASAQAVQKGEPVVGQLFEIQRFDGSRASVINSASPVRDASGKVVGSAVAIQDITALRKAEQALRESEERLHSLYASMTEGLALHEIIYDSRGQAVDYVILDVNPAYEVATGLARERAIGGKASELYGTGQPPYIEAYSQVAASGEPTSFETYFAPMGKHFRISVFSPGKGRFATVFADITERKQAEEALRVALEKYRVLFESFPLGITISDKAGKVVESNKEAERLLGVSQTEHDQRRIDGPEWRIIRPDGGPMPAEEYASVRALQENRLVDNVEMGIVKEGGEVTWINVTAAPIPLAGYGVAIAYGDITERRRAEQALRETRDYLDNLLTYANAPIIVWDPDFRITRFNTAFERLTGRKADDVCGKSLALLFPEERKEEALAHIRRAVAGERWEVVEIPILRVDGMVRTVLWNSATLYAADGTTVVATIAQGQDMTERKQAEQALRETRDYLDNLLTYANAPIIVWDPDFRITRFNTAFERLTGRKTDDVCGKSLALLFPEERKEEALAHIRQAVAGERWEVVEIPILRVDGMVRTVLWNSATLYAADGTTVVATIAQGQDITERKQAEQALQRYADRLRVLHEADQAILAAQSSVEEIAEAAVRHAPQLLNCVRAGVVLYDHQAGEASLLAVHTKGETRLEKGWRGPIYAEWSGMLDALSRGETYVVEDVQEGTSSSFVTEALRSEGVRAYVHVPLVVQGQLVGSLALGMDTPGPLGAEQKEIALELAIEIAVGIQQARLYEQIRRHAEDLEDLVSERTAALQASEARFRTIFEEAAIGIALVDLRGRYMESNSVFQKMLSYSGEELRSLTFPEVTYSEDVATDRALFEDMVAGKRGSCRSEKRYICRDGQVRWASRILSLVRDAEGQPQYAISMVEDITEQRQALDALMRTEKLAVAGRLAASLAHEINNPLQSVIGCLALADEALAEGGDVERYLKVAREELKRVARVVAQLRDLHRPPTSEERVPVDVNTLLERVLTLSKKKCEESKVKVVRKAAKDLPPLRLASDRIEQVFLNLVLNAIDAMPGGGRLRVSTSRTSRPLGVRITFADRGMGISAKDLPHIFEPFYSTKSEGLGLGLFVSYDAVKQHGGRMDVESQEGEGSTFTVWLPVQTRSEGRAFDESKEALSGGGKEEND